MHQFAHPISKSVEAALKDLLSNKHLYQSVSPYVGFIPEVASRIIALGELHDAMPFLGTTKMILTTDDLIKSGNEMISQPWIPMIGSDHIRWLGDAPDPVTFQMPTINTFCENCADRWPFNPVFLGAMAIIESLESQRYFFGYQCQNCKGTDIRFMVRREGLKLRLVGRDPIEKLPVPRALPKQSGKFYGDAQIAHHAGQTLAAIFLLRTFIEHYWRSLPVVKALIQQGPRATGDEQGSAYQKTLPDDFKNRFPSLTDIYGKLSAAMHEADANGQLFEECSSLVIEHFEARRTFKLDPQS